MISIGVVVTSFNYGKYIPEAASSILESKRRPDRVVFVDDASTDGDGAAVMEAAERLREAGLDAVGIQRERNGGSSAARNTGIRHCETEWIMSLDGDDLLLPWSLDHVEERAYEKGLRKYDVIQGGRIAFDMRTHRKRKASGVLLYPHHRASPAGVPPITAAFLAGGKLATANSAFLRAFWEISPYDEGLRTSEDSAFWVRCAQNGARFIPSSRPISKVRFHTERKVFNPKRRKVGLRRRDIRDIIQTPYPVDFLATESHFIDHLAPIWNELPYRKRGRFITVKRLKEYAEGYGLRVSAHFDNRNQLWRVLKIGRGPVLMCAHGDYEQAERAGRAVIFFEHGAGQTYRGQHSSYAGYGGRKGVVLFVCPGPRSAERTRNVYASVPVIEAGCSKLDPYLPAGTLEKWSTSSGRRPVVAISFHWDCRVYPETRSGFDEFKSALPDLAYLRDEGVIELIGHGHPRAFSRPPGLAKHYEAHSIEVVRDFDEVLRRADLYICDNSSTIFEFAATGKPVVLMNPSFYRRDIKHGLRFWDCASVGIGVDHPSDLAHIVLDALRDPEEVQEARRDAIGKVYTFTDGKSTERICKAIEDVLDVMYPDPIQPHFKRPLRILSKRPITNHAGGGRSMKETEEPKTEYLYTSNGFYNKYEEGRVRANSHFWTNVRRAKALVEAGIAEYPTAAGDSGSRPAASPKERPAPGPKVKKPAGPSTKKRKRAQTPTGHRERLEAEMKSFRAEISKIEDPEARARAERKLLDDFEERLEEDEPADPSEEGSVDDLKALEEKGGMYKGFHISAGAGGGWREIREAGPKGTLRKKMQGFPAAVSFIDHQTEIVEAGDDS